SINDSNTVAFRAFVGPGDQGGEWVYVGNGGALTPIASNRDGRFYEVEYAPAIDSFGLVAFTARLFLGGVTFRGPGIFVGSGGALQPIATTAMFTPGSMFSGLSDTVGIDDSGRIVFWGNFGAGNGLFASDGNTTTKLVDNLGGMFSSFGGCCPTVG